MTSDLSAIASAALNLEGQFAALRQSGPAGSVPRITAFPEDENRPLTILFADMSGSVEKTYHLDPEDTAALLNEVLNVMADSILRSGGQINSFLGDGLLAFFGSPQAHENDPERAIIAALEIREGVQKLGLRVTIGINTGEVYLGRVGSEQHQEFTARGRAINLAARLQGKAESGQILVGEATHRLTRQAFEFLPLSLELKGVPGPVVAYEAVRALTHPEKTRGIEGLPAQLQGRDEEMAVLRQALAEVCQGHGQMLSVTGEAGVGKSRLIAELRHLAVNSPTDSPDQDGNSDPIWLEGRCLEQSGSTSYWPFIDMFRQHFAWRPDENDRARGSRIQFSLHDMTKREELTPERCEQIGPLLENVLSVALGEGPDQALFGFTPEQIKNQTCLAIQDFFTALAKRQPLVLVLEDFHWTDSLSLDVAGLLMERLAQVPLLLVCVYRPEQVQLTSKLRTLPTERCPERYKEIGLQALSPRESDQLVYALLGTTNVPIEVTHLVLKRAQGNPFFVEEILRTLIETEAISRHNGEWHAGQGLEGSPIPDSIQAVILSRVDRLEENARQVIQTAAVIGRLFRRNLLGYLRGNGKNLDLLLQTLSDREMLYKDRLLPEEEYSFKHVLTQETIYKSLLRRRRVALHQEIAQAIEALYKGSLDEYYEQLAYHYDKTALLKKAVEYLQKAGEKAHGAYLNAEAIKYFERAIERIESAQVDHSQRQWKDEIVAQLREALADVLELAARHDDAKAVYAKAVAEPDQRPAITRSRLYRKIGKICQVQRNYTDASDAFGLGEAALGAAPTERGLEWWHEWLQIQIDRALMLYFQAQTREMAELFQRMQPALEQYGTPSQRASFFLQRALMTLRAARMIPTDETMADVKVSFAASHEVSNLSEKGLIQFCLGFCHMWREECDPAEEHLQGALRLSERIGDVTLQSRCLNYLALVERKRGHVEQARHFCSLALPIATAGHMVEYMAMVKATLAWASWREEDFASVEEHGRAALELWHQMPVPYPCDWMALWPLIGVALTRGQMAEAIESTRGMLKPPQQPLPQTLTAVLEEAVQASDQGLPEAARAHLTRAIQLGRNTGYS